MESSEETNVMNEEQLLEFCQRLGLAEDGYLDESQLNIICRCIGLPITDEAIKDLFEVLDANHDGRVSIANLCYMLKTMGSAPSSGSSSNRSSPEKKAKPGSNLGSPNVTKSYRSGNGNHGSGSSVNNSGNGSVKDNAMHVCFSLLDPLGSGVTKLESLLDYWSSIGLSHELAFEVLGHFGIEANFGSNIDLHDFEKCIEEEVYNNKNILPWIQVALCMYRSEVHYLKTSLETARHERNKLQSMNDELSKQSQMLAQEIDEQNAKLELSNKILVENLVHKYEEQIGHFKSEFSKEKSAMADNMREFEDIINKLKLEDIKSKQEVHRLQNENKSLEKEIEKLSENIRMLETNKTQLESEIFAFKTIQKNLEDMELKSIETNRKQEEKLNLVQLEVQLLRDTNDELSAQLESIRQDFKSFRQNQCLHSQYTHRTEDEGGGDGTSPMPSLISDNFNLQAQALQLTNTLEGEDELDANVELQYKTVFKELETQSTQTDWKDENSEFQSKLAELAKEKAELQNQINELETNLNLLAQEYEKTEDYWTAKLADERVSYELEKQENDDRLQEIQDKIKEYEDLLCESIKTGSKLDPVTEFYSFERQMTELESENREARTAIEKYQMATEELSGKLQDKTLECSALEEEVKSLRTKCIDYEHRISSIVLTNEEQRADSKAMELEWKKREEELMKRIVDLEEQVRNNNNEESQNHKTFLIDHSFKSVKSMPHFNTCINSSRSSSFGDGSGHPRIKFTHVDVAYLTQLKQKCKQYEEECWSLSQTVMDKEKYTEQLLAEMKYQHGAEIQHYESLVEANQHLIDHQLAQIKSQDEVIRDLITRNKMQCRCNKKLD